MLHPYRGMTPNVGVRTTLTFTGRHDVCVRKLPLTILAIDRTACVVFLSSPPPAAAAAAAPSPATASDEIMLPLPTLDPRYDPIAVLRLRLA